MKSYLQDLLLAPYRFIISTLGGTHLGEHLIVGWSCEVRNESAFASAFEQALLHYFYVHSFMHRNKLNDGSHACTYTVPVSSLVKTTVTNVVCV